MTGDFNIRDQLWDPSFPHHTSISDDLFIITDLFNLDLSIPTNLVPTRYSNTTGESDSVIDLIFLCSGLNKPSNYVIHPEQYLTSNHAPLTITISIVEELVLTSKFLLPKNSKEEEAFIKEVAFVFKSLDTSNLSNHESLEQVVNLLVARVKQAWNANARRVNIMKHSKKWQDEDYNCSLNKYRELKSLKDWKSFKRTVKITKRSFFNIKIQKVANKSYGPQKLMNWVNKHKLPTIEAIKYDNQPCLLLDGLQNALHSSFNTALYHQIDINILDEIGSKQVST